MSASPTAPPARRWFLLAAAGAALLGASVCRPVVVDGPSMEPTFRDGQLLWMNPLHYRLRPPERGEVVVIRHKGEFWVKRVYQVPGGTLSYMGSARVQISPVRETASTQRWRGPENLDILRVRSIRIPDDSIFVVGDNPMRSADSRHVGPVPLRNVVGRVYAEPDNRKLMAVEGHTEPLSRSPGSSPALSRSPLASPPPAP